MLTVIKKLLIMWVVLVGSTLAGSAYAGPVILGGDDLADHGSVSVGVNLSGWEYIENATDGILANVTRPGAAGNGVAVLGSSITGDPGAAMASVGVVLSVTVNYYKGASTISTFFADLASGAVNPEMLYIVGTRASGDLDSSEGTVLTANAAAIAAFVASGGGVLAHGSGSTAYGWLTALLPGIVETSTCDNPVTLTAAGILQFPGLTSANVDAGPCHSSFSGNLGGLSVLANDVNGLNVIIGGATVRIGATIPVPSLGVWGVAILVVSLMMAGLLGFRRRLS